MKFGVFDYIEASDIPLGQIYEERLTLIQSLEAAGFYGYHLSEHHATPLSMTPSPSIFLAAAARETRRIRLGTLLYLLPLYHPIRLLEVKSGATGTILSICQAVLQFVSGMVRQLKNGGTP